MNEGTWQEAGDRGALDWGQMTGDQAPTNVFFLLTYIGLTDSCGSLVVADVCVAIGSFHFLD